MVCESCGRALVELDWNSYCYIYICDNPGCTLFHTPQGKRIKTEEPAPVINTTHGGYHYQGRPGKVKKIPVKRKVGRPGSY